MQQNPRFLFFFLVSLVVFLPLILSEARELNAGGEWTLIHNARSDPHVKEIAEFAVSEYNKQFKTRLKLYEVVTGKTQVVSGSGMNYRLLLTIDEMLTLYPYVAVVLEKAGSKSKTLTYFKQQLWV